PGFALYAFTCAFLVALFCLALYRASFPTRRSSDLAFKLGRSGRLQLEAAIQSVHAELARTGRTDWTAIALFYERLTRLSPASEQPQLLKQRDLKRGWPFSSRLTATPLRTISRIGPF